LIHTSSDDPKKEKGRRNVQQNQASKKADSDSGHATLTKSAASEGDANDRGHEGAQEVSTRQPEDRHNAGGEQERVTESTPARTSPTSCAESAPRTNGNCEQHKATQRNPSGLMVRQSR
jgi:hypothetical protein